ncbi:MAG: TonB-dependent receptor plug domain-containing protein, partial [Pseudomonadota bacterium]
MTADLPASTRGDGGSGGAGNVAPATQALVQGKGGVSLGAASLPAQVQTINSQDIQQLIPRGDYANLFRKTSGVKAVYYGQGRIGSGIMMRGFRNGSGNEVAIFIDGVPQNYPSGTWHGQSDISWLVPEAIENIEVIKGPFSALYGDFALGGVVNITTKKSEPSSSANSYGGSFGNFRVLGTATTDVSTVTPYLAQEFFTIDGYRDNSQLKQWSTFDKISFPLPGGTFSLRYNYYRSDWGQPGYWPLNWVKSGAVDPITAYSTSDGGSLARYELVANFAPTCGERGLYATLYTSDYHYFRYATWLPVGSSQSGTQDDRRVWGGSLSYNLVFGDIGSLAVGGQTRHDVGTSQRYNTLRRQRTATTTYAYDLRLSNWALFVQGQIKPHEKLKLVG